jgi:hypothetical protein
VGEAWAITPIDLALWRQRPAAERLKEFLLAAWQGLL